MVILSKGTSGGRPAARASEVARKSVLRITPAILSRRRPLVRRQPIL
jgi:hypothetical protein